MTKIAVESTKNERFGRVIERRDDHDFPFYNTVPIKVAGWKWLVIAASCVVGFVILLEVPQPSQLAALLPRTAFTVLPLAVFIAMIGRYWKTLFRRITGRDVLTMIAFWVLNFLVSAAVALLVSGGDVTGGMTTNAATDNVIAGGPVEIAAFYLGTGIQLFGEELFTLLPFLGLLYVLHTKAHLSRRTSILLAWLVSAIWFGAAHLSTYDWNFVQAIVVIGSARLVLTLAYIRTKNIAVSTGAHVLNDWATFSAVMLSAVIGY